ncbi:hypothetical protein M409DRAFT_22190 [Zasmidium cellare ATCC 36951]|uniref:Uncharacterized protein n=1 Tax=Zasmidium cellare ATCC 36951 TaxID=1080233 RepID=A0A6A6CMD6_ZASCE|nr:uncharacterized protein M409DRAFT_22190 [Zasmidium cellare ATCC 36951]KAF2167378.1 hypothetical protein M409DRAFT_22190 [Zasmidium cellare ATCC 36951]
MAQQVEYRRASLLGSPPEIRNRIFLDVAMHHIFKANGEKQVFTLQSLTMGKNIIFRPFRANKQMLRELRTLFFGHITLSLSTEEMMKSHLPLYGHPNGNFDMATAKWRSGRLQKITEAKKISTFQTHRTRIAYFITHPKNIERTAVMTMLMPHPAVRQSIRFLQLHLLAPRFIDGSSLQYSYTCGADGTDWLYPLREIKKIGFVKLKKLHVVVKYFSTQIMVKDTKKVTVAGDSESQGTSTSRSVEEWIQEHVTGMDLEGIEYSLEIVYGETR